MLLRNEPLLVTFIDEIPHLEGAARGKDALYHLKRRSTDRDLSVSVPTVFQSIQTLVNGLATVNTEIIQLSREPLEAGDRFLKVMQVRLCRPEFHFYLTHTCQPFATGAKSSVTALSHMMDSLDSELKSLLSFYGEVAEGPEASKPEEFFGLILSFSASLQVY